MPPRAPSRRGRGRGRGAATRGEPAASSELQANAESTPPAQRQDVDMRDASYSSLAAGEGLTIPGNDATQPSPNSSPATLPTEDPAPTPARAPVQRLESLSRPSGARAGAAAAGASTGGMRGSKFKPKNRRTDQEARERAEREEQQRLLERNQAAARESGLGFRGGDAARRDREGGRGEFGRRARGDAMGARRGRGGGGGGDGLSSASGLFGVAPGFAEKKSTVTFFGAAKGGGGAGRSSTANTPSGGPQNANSQSTSVKHENGSATQHNGDDAQKPQVKSEYPEPIYPDDNNFSATAPRIDIEMINIVSSDEEDIQTSKGKGRVQTRPQKGGQRPIRIFRQEHKDRATVVNTESAFESAVAEEAAGDAGLETILRGQEGFTSEERKRDPQLTQTPSEPLIKTEPRRLSISDDTQSSGTEPLSVPTKDSSTAIRSLSSEPRGPPSHPSTKPARKPSANSKRQVHLQQQQQHSHLQTEEERAEYERHQEDVRILAQELGGPQARRVQQQKQKQQQQQQLMSELDAEGDASMDGSSRDDANDDGNIAVEAQDEKEGRLYLFQLPPILPPLVSVAERAARKAAEEEENGERRRRAAGDGGGVVGDGPDEVIVVKTEESGGGGAAGSSSRATATTTTTTTKKNMLPSSSTTGAAMSDVVTQEGLVGKMVLRKSGKLELDWGGASLAVGRATVGEFLTLGVVVVDAEEGGGGGEGLSSSTAAVRGESMAMGKIMGKFVVTPDWDKLF